MYTGWLYSATVVKHSSHGRSPWFESLCIFFPFFIRLIVYYVPIYEWRNTREFRPPVMWTSRSLTLPGDIGVTVLTLWLMSPKGHHCHQITPSEHSCSYRHSISFDLVIIFIFNLLFHWRGVIYAHVAYGVMCWKAPTGANFVLCYLRSCRYINLKLPERLRWAIA